MDTYRPYPHHGFDIADAKRIVKRVFSFERRPVHPIRKILDSRLVQARYRLRYGYSRSIRFHQ